MALFTVADVCKEARQVYLVDTELGEIFDDATLLPFVIRAFDELNTKLARIGHQVTEAVIATGLVLSFAKEYVPTVTDILQPLSMWERNSGGSEDDWREMVLERNLGDGQPQAVLGNWDYAQNKFLFRGATNDREIRIRYIRFLPAISNISSQPVVLNSKSFLSARTAALAAGHIGGNPEKAAYIQIDANDSIEDLMGISINAEQATPVRRRPFRR